MVTRDDIQEKDPSLRLAGATLHCIGPWTLPYLPRLESALARLAWPETREISFDMGKVDAMDSAGAWLFCRTKQALEQQGKRVAVNGLSSRARTLLELVQRTSSAMGVSARPRQRGLLEAIGRNTIARLREGLGFIAFVGEVALVTSPLLVTPARIRWRIVLVELADAGHRALPIVGMLAFLIGIVIAYQGGVQLRQYGANIFIADVVGLSVMRELAPLITAIIVAGRSGSAYTAQIGTMRVTEEVDALRTMGIHPFEQLVLPKLLALLIALPLLTVYADILGIFGGLVMAQTVLGVNTLSFIDRLGEAVSLRSYLIGIGKAPVFAVFIALVGCYQGFKVGGSAESVGRQTTISVVQSIFLVIAIDGVFSIIFSWLDI